MADYFTHLAFTIPASRADAERFIMLIEATTSVEEGGAATPPPDIEHAFTTPTKSGANVVAAIFDNENFGIDCLFDDSAQTLTIYDHGGSPAIWPLAECLQRLFPAKLPLGFVYAQTCSKPRPGGFGGGVFAIGIDSIVHQTLDQVLDDELAGLKGVGNAP